MTADPTYMPKTYRRAGGDETIIADGGKQIVEPGGQILDESGTASGEGLSPLIWGDCPRLQMLIDPTLGHFIGDDFVQVNAQWFTTAEEYVLAGQAGAFTHVASDPDGIALLNAPGTDNDECNINPVLGVGCIKLDATTNWWFESRVKLNQIATSQGVFVGLIEDSITMGVDFMTDDTMALKVQDLIGFQVIAATDIAAILQSVMILSSQVVVNATVHTAEVAYVKLGMKCVDGTVTFFIDGVADATTVDSDATNFPLDKYVVPAFATKCGDGNQNTLSVDWWYAAQLR